MKIRINDEIQEDVLEFDKQLKDARQRAFELTQEMKMLAVKVEQGKLESFGKIAQYHPETKFGFYEIQIEDGIAYCVKNTPADVLKRALEEMGPNVVGDKE